MRPTYCVPSEAGLQSTASSVAKRLANILNSLGMINSFIVDGQVEEDVFRFKTDLIQKLRADGWQIEMPEGSENFRVRKPKG